MGRIQRCLTTVLDFLLRFGYIQFTVMPNASRSDFRKQFQQ
jgi:hypothetical protein